MLVLFVGASADVSEAFPKSLSGLFSRELALLGDEAIQPGEAGVAHGFVP
jgi:hypothetical protein